MVALAVGQVVLVPFPFSDLTQSKLRPAVVLADAGRGDWVLCQVTSKAYGDPRAVELSDASFQSGGLQLRSFARPAKPFTASESLLVKRVGELSSESRVELVRAAIRVFAAEPSSSPAKG